MEKLKEEMEKLIYGEYLDSHMHFNDTERRHHASHEASQILTLFQDWLKKNNYVQLSPDQRLPLSGPYSLREAHIVRQARHDMLNDKFRRVE